MYNPSGKYWVKFYFLGKEKKIEIDDKMPVNYKGQCFFPRSVHKDELWSCLMTKALIKLINLTENIELTNLVGSGFVIYSLTGHVAQTI